MKRPCQNPGAHRCSAGNGDESHHPATTGAGAPRELPPADSSRSAPRNCRPNQYTGRIDHNILVDGLAVRSFIIIRDSRTEPTLQGNNLPGFGDYRPAKRALLSLGYTHVFSPTLTNELRAGVNRVRIDFIESDTASPAAFGIASPSSVFPNVNVASSLIFGGISGFPQGRGDTTYQYDDTISWVHGKQSIRAGVEFRRFDNNNFNGGTGGVLSFGTMAGFLAGTPTRPRRPLCRRPRRSASAPSTLSCRTISKSASI